MIKAVLFDFGGVLSEAGRAGTIRRIFDVVYGLDPDAMGIDDLFEKMWRGQMDETAFLEEIHRRHPETAHITAAEFRSHMDAFQKSTPVYGLANELREQGIRTGILSNVFGIGVIPLRLGGFYDMFDPVILSCEVGMAKPEPAIYTYALKAFGIPLQPEEVIFIDDQKAYLEPAAALGIHTVLARDPAQIVADTKAVLAAASNHDATAAIL